nr:MAG TPA: hypothetical protein [Caudoviricetes sp.]
MTAVFCATKSATVRKFIYHYISLDDGNMRFRAL